MKIYMNKLCVGLFSFALTAGMMSCSDDYLDTTPTSSVGTSTAMGTTENAMKALNGIARMMTTQPVKTTS